MAKTKRKSIGRIYKRTGERKEKLLRKSIAEKIMRDLQGQCFKIPMKSILKQGTILQNNPKLTQSDKPLFDVFPENHCIADVKQKEDELNITDKIKVIRADNDYFQRELVEIQKNRNENKNEISGSVTFNKKVDFNININVTNVIGRKKRRSTYENLRSKVKKVLNELCSMIDQVWEKKKKTFDVDEYSSYLSKYLTFDYFKKVASKLKLPYLTSNGYKHGSIKSLFYEQRFEVMEAHVDSALIRHYGTDYIQKIVDREDQKKKKTKQ